MYKFSFIGSFIYYSNNIVGTFIYENKTYLVKYVTLNNEYKTITAPTKKEIRKELSMYSKRYK